MTTEGITELLAAWRRGDQDASDRLMSLVYDELHSLARRQLAGRGGETLRTTVLVHEAYIRLGRGTKLTVHDRNHFFAFAAKVMRHLVVDHARRRSAAKRGGPVRPQLLEDADVRIEERSSEIVALDEALDRLAAVDERLSRIVELRFFAGLSVDEIAGALDCSPRTVKRDWRKARAFLYRELTDRRSSAEPF